MPLANFQSYKVSANELSSSTKQNNMIQAMEDATNTIDNSKISTNAAIATTKLATVQAARVFHSAAQSISNGVETTLAFNSERFDTDAIHDNVTNNSRLTCKTAGIYEIGGHIEWAANAGGNRTLLMKVNGTTYITSDVGPAAVGGAESHRQGVSTIYQLAVNDYIELVAFQSSGVALNVNASVNLSPEFYMVRLGT